MKNIRIVVIIFLIGIITVNSSCKKKSTDKYGNANISARTFSASTWSWSSPDYYVNFDVPEITSDNINSAAVMVYFSTGGSWIAVPYTQYTSTSDYHMGFSTTAGQVQVTWFYDSSLSNGDNPNVYYSTTVKYKVVVIPPVAAKANSDIDLKNYAAVKERFNLKD